MKVLDLLETRRVHWRELEMLCVTLESRAGMRSENILRMASLYRAACADLALADSYQLPPNTVNYLHQLVARAHNQLYRSRKFDMQKWLHDILVLTPRRLYRDNYVRLAFVLFWGLFITSMILARNSESFSSQMIPVAEKEKMRDSFAEPFDGRNFVVNSQMAGWYINHNAGIGIECFAWGVLFGVGGLFKLVYNGAFLGAVFGYMSSIEGPSRTHFFTFVTAHGPFELTAIVLSAAAGMRMGFSLISTGSRSRADALAEGARESFPTICVAIVLFVFAAFIEGFISPSALPFEVKATISAISSGLLLYYFVVLGHPPIEENT